MTELLCLKDSYLREFEGKVTAATGRVVYLDRTAFYPRGGGQPSDVGVLLSDGRKVRVLEVYWDDIGVAHSVDSELNEGLSVKGEIDWELRYAHMRHHTAVHILSGVMFRNYGAAITGGQIYADRARVDFDIDEINAESIQKIQQECNRVVQEGRKVTARVVPQSVALSMPELVRTKTGRKLVERLSEVRLVEIEGFDVQSDGGTHVSSTREVGQIKVTGVENKGKHNKRFEIILGPVMQP